MPLLNLVIHENGQVLDLPGSSPLPLEARRNIDFHTGLPCGGLWEGTWLTPIPALKEPFDGFRNEAADRSINMAVAKLALLVREKPLGNDQIQLVLGSRHGHVK